MLDFLTLPFMQRALIAGLILAPLLALSGNIVTLKKIAFLGDGIAHASLAGIAIAILLEVQTMPVAIIWATLIAISIFLIERSKKLSTDTILAVLFSSSLALGIILMHYTPGFQPELISFLFGSILSITSRDLLIITPLALIALIFLIKNYKQLLQIAFEENLAKVNNVNTDRLTLLFYIITSWIIVMSVKVLGIILASGLLIIPSATSKIISNSLKSHTLNSLALSLTTATLGLILSYYADLPSGATIILLSSTFFFIALLLQKK